MRILLIGANGTIGSAIATALGDRHEIVACGRHHGDYKVDISDPESIRRFFEQVGPFDALISAAGSARFKPLADLAENDFEFSLQNKLMGQANLVRIGERFISSPGSFTLTSGTLANNPMPGSAAVSMVNAGLNGFGRAAALELKDRDIRVNIVSPPWVSETLVAMGRDGSNGLPAATVAKAYADSVENPSVNGQILNAEDY